MSVTSKNDPSALYTFDRIRLMAMQCWISTLERTYDIDPGVIELACEGAHQKYNDLKFCPEFEIPLVLEKLLEAIGAWTTWQALTLQSQLHSYPVTANEICNFARDLECMLQRLTTETDERFLL